MVPPRVVLAMQAMKAIGIPPQKVKPVLKNLLKVYDNNWELIEEEHYRVLADAIFDFQEEEARKKKVENFDSVEDQNEEARINGGSETPMTRPRLRQEDDQPSHSRFNSGGESSSKRRKLDETISPETSLGRENTEPVPPQVQSFVGERRMEPTSTQAYDIEKRPEPVSPQTHLREKRTEPVLPQIAPREKRLVSERMSNNNCFKEPKIEPGTDTLPKDVPSHHHCNTLIKHRSEPFTSNIPQFEAPIAVIHPPTLASARKKACPDAVNKVGSSIESDSTERTDSVETLASRHVNRLDGKKDVPELTCKNRTSPEPGSIQETSENIEIASSTSGEDPQKHHFFYCKECPLERSKNEVQPDPCKGHLVKKFIKECWSKCGCNKQCGNRVVQRGITCNLQVFLTSEGKGWGLRTLDKLPRGTFVCEYVGEVLTNMELYDRTMQITGNEKHTYPVLLDADWGSEGVLKDEDALCLDATFYGNVARFINHRCIDANLVGIPVEVETPDHHYYHLAFFTTRKVEELEELTWDYGIDFDDHDHPVKAFRCCCGSKFCRDMKRSSRTKQRALILR